MHRLDGYHDGRNVCQIVNPIDSMPKLYTSGQNGQMKRQTFGNTDIIRGTWCRSEWRVMWWRVVVMCVQLTCHAATKHRLQKWYRYLQIKCIVLRIRTESPGFAEITSFQFVAMLLFIDRQVPVATRLSRGMCPRLHVFREAVTWDHMSVECSLT